MSAPLPRGAVHLLVAHEAIRQGYGASGYVTVCGQLVTSSDLLPQRCPAECDDDPRYCPECVRAALRWSVEVGDGASEAVNHLLPLAVDEAPSPGVR